MCAICTYTYLAYIDTILLRKKVSYNLMKKSPFLAIQLLLEFGFGHATLKPDIIDYSTLQTVYKWPFTPF